MVTKIPKFRKCVLQNFPFIEQDFDALTDYELLCKVVEYLNTVIASQNQTMENVESLTQAFNTLTDYVNNYFENLDVQEEINNKLDQMAQDGSLTALIKAYIDPLIEAQDLVIEQFQDEVNGDLSNLQTSVNTQINALNTAIQSLASGSPLVASSTSEMTDTTKVYVNTTDGKWYYYDGDSWEIGGTYQASEIADESVTLDKLADDTKYNLNSRINTKDRLNYEIKYSIDVNKINFTHSELDLTTGDFTGVTNSKLLFSTDLIYIPDGYVIEGTNSSENLNVALVYYNEDFGYEVYPNTSKLHSIIQGNSFRTALYNSLDHKYGRLRISNITTTDIDTSQLSNLKLWLRKFVQTPTDNTVVKNLVKPVGKYSGYINDSRPYELSSSNDYYTYKPIPVESGEHYFIASARKMLIFDTNMEVVEDGHITSNQTNVDFVPAVDGYVMISVATSTLAYMCHGTQSDSEAYLERLPDYIQLSNMDNINVEPYNLLTGKKITFLGDSFTHGDFANAPEDDYHITEGMYTGEYKVYPYIIGNRNKSLIYNLASNGMTITQISDVWTNYISDTVLGNIPSDSDYVIIKIGINDDLHHQGADIGSITDNVRNTFYGAWNNVISWLIGNRPNTKIGIIVSNGISDLDYVTATINIAHKYGIAYLNESTDDRVPLLIRTLRTDVASSVKTARNNQWFVNTDPETPNSHPNAKCHEYESTIVENFIRSL